MCGDLEVNSICSLAVSRGSVQFFLLVALFLLKRRIGVGGG